jgi:hypothetical protein
VKKRFTLDLGIFSANFDIGCNPQCGEKYGEKHRDMLSSAKSPTRAGKEFSSQRRLAEGNAGLRRGGNWRGMIEEIQKNKGRNYKNKR